MRRLLPALLALSCALAASGARPVGAAAPGAPAATSGTSVGTIRKEHGVDLDGGLKAVRLTVPVDTWGMKGRTLAAVVFFHDAATGAPIRSELPAWADPASCQVRVVSQDVVLEADGEGVDFALRVPYQAFPCRPVCPHEVEARVRIVERAGPAGRVLLSTGLTRFWVGR